MFLSFPGSHVKAHFAGQSKQSVCGQTGNGEQIDTTFFEEQVTHIDTIADAVAGLNLFLWLEDHRPRCRVAFRLV